jgi:hypothetical protein
VNTEFDIESMRWLLHHELFHQLDFAGDCRLDPDSEWESLNAIEFRYTNDVEKMQVDPRLASTLAGVNGFVNRYAMSSSTEDKAELYALMMATPVEARRRLAEDQILRRKARRIQEMIDAFGPYCAHLLGD